MTGVARFLDDEAGAATIDWVALTSGGLLLGMLFVYATFNFGVFPLVSKISLALAEAEIADAESAGQMNDCLRVNTC